MVSARDVAMARGDGTVSPIPPITDPLGRSWRQPDRSLIEIDDTHALMTRLTFESLADYSASNPSGVYVGKMWRRHDGVFDVVFRSAGGTPEWLLCWFGPCKKAECPGCDKFVSNNWRKILIVEEGDVHG